MATSFYLCIFLFFFWHTAWQLLSKDDPCGLQPSYRWPGWSFPLHLGYLWTRLEHNSGGATAPILGLSPKGPSSFRLGSPRDFRGRNVASLPKSQQCGEAPSLRENRILAASTKLLVSSSSSQTHVKEPSGTFHPSWACRWLQPQPAVHKQTGPDWNTGRSYFIKPFWGLN